MLKSIRDVLIGVIVAGAVSAALAATGQPPVNGFGAVDGTWLNGLAAGQNHAYLSGVTAAGTTQATCTPLPATAGLIEVDTTASSTGVCLPPALPGTDFAVYNNGANTLTFYPAILNNPVTAAQDTINNTTSLTATTKTMRYFFCAKAGIWAAQ